MQVKEILQDLLSLSIHKTRIKSLTRVVSAVIDSKNLQLTQLGRSLSGQSTERSNIRLIDRLLSNRYYQKEVNEFYRRICHKLIDEDSQPIISVDWSGLPNSMHKTQGGEHCILRASLAVNGRGITLYEEVHPKSKEGNSAVHSSFLNSFSSILPEGCKPCLLTDSGYKTPWFKAVLTLGWNYVGRLRGTALYDDSDGFKPLSNLHAIANNIAHYLGVVLVTKENKQPHHLVLYKSKPKGRHKMTKTKKRDQSNDSLKHSKSWKEPWVLVTSIESAENNPALIVEMYKRRMTIEENFRDVKSTRYGLSMNDNETIKPERYVTWLMLAALATLVAWICGAVAEKNNLHYDFQANSYRNKRVLSFFYLGCQIIRKKIQVPIEWGLIKREELEWA